MDMKQILIFTLLCSTVSANAASEKSSVGYDLKSIVGKYGYSYDGDGKILNGCKKITKAMTSKIKSCETGKKSDIDCKLGDDEFLSVYKSEQQCKKSLESNDV